jgi:anti-sigma regulatory factor (Ser/Thr protein kinase)
VLRNALHIGGDPQIDFLLRRFLTPESWNVQDAPSNASALKLVEAHQSYDLIVTSEKTSGEQDVELLRKIRHLRLKTRLIILANKSATTDVIAAMREHAFSYFSRPFSLHALEGMIRVATEGRCWNDGIEVISATQQGIRLRMRCDFETADRLLQFLQEIEELPDPERKQLATASRELLYNAIEYGGKLDPTNYVEIDHVRSRDKVMCRITDHGPGFSFDKIPHAAISNPADDPTYHIRLRQEQDMRPGGYGILVARKMVDDVIYGRNGNEVQLVKYIGSAKLLSA